MAKTQITDRLAKVVQALSTSYGWIIIDTPPDLGVLTQNALVAADYALIPTPCTGLAIPTLHQMKQLIERVQERQNIWLQLMGVLVTMKDGRTPLQKNMKRNSATSSGRTMSSRRSSRRTSRSRKRRPPRRASTPTIRAAWARRCTATGSRRNS